MSSKTNTTKYGDMLDDSTVFQTRRATEEFPAGPECDLTCDDLPDTEMGYFHTKHYKDRRKERERPSVTDRVIDLLLNDSEVRQTFKDIEDSENKYVLQREIEQDGKTREWSLVIADDGEESDPRWVLVTVFSNYHGAVGVTNRYLDRKQRERGER